MDPRATRPTAVLAATVAAAMLVTANVSVLNVALPELSFELGASQAQGQWMVDIYAVVLASLLLPAGALGDRFGRRMILLVGMTVLALANFATLALDTPVQVIMARGVSGIGAAFVFPATLSTITATLPSDQRSRGVAIWTASVSIGGFIGILGSGVLIENFWWGSVFLGMGIAAVLVGGLCAVAVPDSSDPDDAHLDPIGALLSIVAVGGLVLGIIEGPVEGWTSALALGGLVAGAVALVGFIFWEWNVDEPLLDIRLFATSSTRAGSLSVFTQFLGAFGVFFLVVFYLSVVRGYGALQIGLALIPISIGLLPASLVAIPLARRFGRRAVGSVGLLTMAAGFAYGTTIDVDSGLSDFLVTMIVMGIGFGLAGPPATEAIVESLPAAKQGVASALNDVLRELGAAIGIAVAGSAFNAGYRSSVDDLTGFPAEVVDGVRETPFAVAAVVGDLGEQGPLLVDGVNQAVIDGWGQAMWALVVAMVVGTAGFAVWATGNRDGDVVDLTGGAGYQSSPSIATAAAPSATSDTSQGIAQTAPGPLGVMELAAAAEDDLGRLEPLLAQLVRELEIMERRARVPVEMSSWSAVEQVQVAERAAIAMAAPLAELTGRAAGVLSRVQAVDPQVSGARAELVRLGRPAASLGEMNRQVDRVVTLVGSAATLALRLQENVGGMATTMSTLRPASREIDKVALSLTEATEVVQRWSEGADLFPPGPYDHTIEIDPLTDRSGGPRGDA